MAAMTQMKPPAAASRHRRRRRRGMIGGQLFSFLLHLTMPLQMILVAVTVTLTLVTGMARAEFHQPPYYQNGFGFDSQLPLMPNHPMEDHLLASNRGVASVDATLVNAANSAWTGSGGGGVGEDTMTTVNYSSTSTSYFRRKEVLLPLIADLIRFHNLSNEVYEAYVLNVDQHHHHHSGQMAMDRNGTRNETGGVVVVTSVVIDSPSAFPFNAAGAAVAGGSVAGGGGGGSTTTAATGGSTQEQLLLNELSFFDLNGGGGGGGMGGVDALEGSMSVLEQNLADLNDFCDTNSRNREEMESSISGGGDSYYSFNNLSYNLIPKDLLEATDLFWSSSSSSGSTNSASSLLVIGGGDSPALRTRANDGDDDPEDRKYLEYINKEGEEEKQEEETESLAAGPVKQEPVENEERLELDSNETEEEKEEQGETEGSTEVKKEEDENGSLGEIIFKEEQFEESDWIEEVTGDEEEEEAFAVKEEIDPVMALEESELFEDFVEEEVEEEEEDPKPVIFNVLDAVDEEEDRHRRRRDWFLNGNEVVSARGSSTFDDIHVDELTEEDSDLVDVLLKQDVDLGFSLILPDAVAAATATEKAATTGKAPAKTATGKSRAATAKKPFCSAAGGATDDTEDDIQKWNALLEIKSDEGPTIGSTKDGEDGSLPMLGSDAAAIWSDAIIDAETGEYIQSLPLQLDDTLIADPRRHLAELAEKEKAQDLENEELIQSLDELLFNTNDSDVSKLVDQDSEELGAVGATSLFKPPSSNSDEEEEADEDDEDFYANDLKDFLDDMMIQAPNMPFQHPRAVMPNYGPHSANNLFQSPYYHHPHHHHPHHHHKFRGGGRAMDPPPSPSLATPPLGLGAAISTCENSTGSLSPLQQHQHYQYNMSHHRWPDFANFMNYPHPPPPPSHPHPGFTTFSGSGMIMGEAYHSYHHHHHHQPHYAPNFSSAVSSSIHLTNSSSDSENGTSAAATYKMEHDLALYSNTSSELNMTSDGFLNSILNDEDLHLMDIGAHEGMYPMRLLDSSSNATNNSTASSMLSSGVAAAAAAAGASLPIGSLADMAAHGDRLEASSDSAVSSMASEPMSSLSDGEWGDTGSDSAQEYSQKYAAHHLHSGHQGGGAAGGGGAGGGGAYGGAPNGAAASRQSTSIAQKKHHMFGKRYFQEQNSTSASSGGPKAGLPHHHQHHSHLAGKYDYSAAYENYHHPNAALLHQSGHHLSVGAAVPQLPPPPPPPPHHHHNQHHHQSHHQLTVDNMKTYQAEMQQQQQQLQQQQHDIKYSCSPDFAYVHQQQQPHNHHPQSQQSQQPMTPRMINEYLQHNHTYPMPPQNSGAVPKPPARDKRRAAAQARAVLEQEEVIAQHNRSMSEHITRDEKRAKALGIPIPVTDIINLPMDEFNERLSKYELSETQLSLIRDIRRRGKNKVAAQNCRKRKLDQIMSLADEVKGVKKQKDELMSDRDMQLGKQRKIKERFTALYRHVFQYLRDPDGNLYSSSQYSLQQSADGSVYLLPRDRKPGGSSSSSSSHMNPPDYGRSQNQTEG